MGDMGLGQWSMACLARGSKMGWTLAHKRVFPQNKPGNDRKVPVCQRFPPRVDDWAPGASFHLLLCCTWSTSIWLVICQREDYYAFIIDAFMHVTDAVRYMCPCPCGQDI
jgi:hypothetical protein